MSGVTRRQFGGLLAAAGSAAGQSSRPNLVYVFADQMRFSAMGCAGNRVVRTPHLDRLASEGILLENAISCAPVCSPYRTQLLTGRYTHHTGVKLSRGAATIGDRLQAAGYHTGYVGKWHVTPQKEHGPSGYVPPEYRAGWDYFAGLEVSHEYFRTHIFEGDDPAPIAVNEYEPRFQTSLAIKFLRENRSRPFALMLSWGPPHNPYQPPEEYDRYSPEEIQLLPNVPAAREAEARGTIARYYGLVTSLDDQMGRLLDALDELGLAENTLVCFTSDHGDMLYSQDQLLKRRPWDESCRVPFLMRFPARLPAGARRELLFGSIDIQPTLLGLLGIDQPAGIDGQDRARRLAEEDSDEPEAVYLQIMESNVNTPLRAQWRAIRTREWLYAESGAFESGEWLLYDLTNDPFQQRNLTGDKRSASRKAELKAALADWRNENGDRVDLRQDFLRKQAQRA